MATKDYYLILGVSRGENVRGIQDAFRELAKRYHPDRAGPGATPRFQDIQEAYEVLSDPEKRRSYDHQLDEADISAPSPSEPIFSRRPPRPEPLIPRGMSVLRDFETICPSFDPLLERFVRNFTGENLPKSERLEALNIEVLLSPEEAAQGVTVPLSVPAFYRCPQCAGSGRDWLFPCLDCHGEGTIEEEETVSVRIPAMIPDRAVIEVRIHGLGIHNVCLRLHVRISR
jgi:molecular chaperone DnaJ